MGLSRYVKDMGFQKECIWSRMDIKYRIGMMWNS